jgi:hypothetical protein
VIIPQNYTIQKFYQYAGYPRFKKYTNIYEAGCPICREGTSWGKKRRCVYLVEKDLICCHNCGWFSKPLKWIQEVTGCNFSEILNEVKEYDNVIAVAPKTIETQKEKQPTFTLPKDAINLFDPGQVDYYNDNKVVNDALDIIKTRRLDTAINRPEALYLSLNDPVHKNRIIIPFYDVSGDIIFYQSRTIYTKNNKYPKYLSKIGGDKSLYNINKINEEDECIFIFEGPIDSFFIKNGTAVAGIQENSHKTFSTLQEKQLSQFLFYKKIWVLDSQWLDRASKTKTKKLLDSGESVFIWPEELGKKYKDINDYCIANNLDTVDREFILSNTSTGIKGNLQLSVVR